MKNNIFNLWQTVGQRLLFSVLVFCMAPLTASSQRESDKNDGPFVTMHGVVTDMSTGARLSGIQLQALGNARYTSMTESDGTFAIRVPFFTTALYVYAPSFASQQVAVIAGDSTQHISIKMMSDKFQTMYGKGTDYTAKSSAVIDHFGVTVDNEVSGKLGADVHTIMRSAALDGGASMFIRGMNSITANAQPLVIIDGIEQDMQRDRYSLHDGQFNNILANISPDDIEKVTVLKNATALYGARGGNGVILIETKRAKSMATRIDANISAGFTSVPKMPTMMDAMQYRNYVTELLGTISGIKEKKIDFHFLNDTPYRDASGKVTNYYYYDYHNNTDWTDEVYRTALTQNYSINVQGGDDVGMYNLSVGYTDAQYAANKNGFNRMNVRFNTDISILKNLDTKFDISIARTSNDVFDNSMPADFSAGTVVSPTVLSLLKSPLVSPYQYNPLQGNTGGYSSLLSDYDNIFSQLSDAYSLANPLAILEYGEGNNKNHAENTYFNVHVEPVYKITSDLSVKALFSYTLNRNAQRYFRPYTGVPSYNIAGVGRVYAKAQSMFAKENNFVGNLQADWAHQYGAHHLAAFAGARYNTFSYDNNDVGVQASGETPDKNPSVDWTGFRKITGTNDQWSQIQWYGNVDYNYMNCYFATLSLLGEANSRFGKHAKGLSLFGVKWALFPSLQLGWVMTNEKWFPRTIGINYLRLNAGIDISGNDGISNYAARTSYTTVRYNASAIGTQLTNVGNDDIQWESTRKINLGLQTYLIDNRVGVKFDYFHHTTDNLLTLKAFATPISGVNRYWSNGGKLLNEGFETTVTVKPIVAKNWNMEVGASVGHYKNTVITYPGGSTTSSVYGDNNILTAEGLPVGVFFGYQTAGILKDDAEAKAAGKGTYLYMKDNAGNAYSFKAGDVHFIDLNSDGKIDEQDKTVIGDPNPDIYGNIFANVSWKNLTLNILFNYSLGNDVYNYQRYVLNSGSSFYNQQVAVEGRWRYEGQQASLPRATFGDPMGNNRFSDRWIEDGSYLRLKSVRLNYQIPIPESWTDWLQGLSVWAEGQNLLTFTKYLGSDPEFSANSNVLYQGIDTGNLAHSRTLLMGVRINL